MAEQTEIERREDERELTKGETVLYGSLILGAFGGFCAIVWAAIKDEQRMLEESKRREEERLQRLEEKKNWLNQEYADGNVIYELKDGSYLVVPRVSEQRRVIK